MIHLCTHCGTELRDVRIDGLQEDARQDRHVFFEVKEYTYMMKGELIHDGGNAAHGKGRCRLILRDRLKALRAAIIAYIERFNLQHEHNCPEDDTCDCAVVQDIEKALKEST